MDVVHEQFAPSKKPRILRRLWRRIPAIALPPRHGFTYRGEDVVQTLARVSKGTDYPRTIRVDHGSEFVSRDLDLWTYAENGTLGLLPARKADR